MIPTLSLAVCTLLIAVHSFIPQKNVAVQSQVSSDYQCMIARFRYAQRMASTMARRQTLSRHHNSCQTLCVVEFRVLTRASVFVCHFLGRIIDCVNQKLFIFTDLCEKFAHKSYSTQHTMQQLSDHIEFEITAYHDIVQIIVLL